MSHQVLAQIEVAIRDEDATYRLRVMKGEAVEEVASGAQSIPEGLRMLADEIEDRGRRSFGARLGGADPA